MDARNPLIVIETFQAFEEHISAFDFYEMKSHTNPDGYIIPARHECIYDFLDFRFSMISRYAHQFLDLIIQSKDFFYLVRLEAHDWGRQFWSGERDHLFMSTTTRRFKPKPVFKHLEIRDRKTTNLRDIEADFVKLRLLMSEGYQMPICGSISWPQDITP